ncbi:hypothetical protein DNTS_026088, partial [Danionella cerebrum]
MKFYLFLSLNSIGLFSDGSLFMDLQLDSEEKNFTLSSAGGLSLKFIGLLIDQSLFRDTQLGAAGDGSLFMDLQLDSEEKNFTLERVASGGMEVPIRKEAVRRVSVDAEAHFSTRFPGKQIHQSGMNGNISNHLRGIITGSSWYQQFPWSQRCTDTMFTVPQKFSRRCFQQKHKPPSIIHSHEPNHSQQLLRREEKPIPKPNQSVSNYIAELRGLSVHCSFGDQLDAMLRDRIVCGVLDEALQRRLLAEPTLTFKEAEDRALAAETALLNARLIRKQQQELLPPEDIHYAAQMQTSTNKMATTNGSKVCDKPCYRPQDLVYMRSYAKDSEKWAPGVITEVTGPLSYRVRTSDGQVHRRHVDQLRDRIAPSWRPSGPESEDNNASLPNSPEIELPELRPTTMEFEHPGEEDAGTVSMSEPPCSRRYE